LKQTANDPADSTVLIYIYIYNEVTLSTVILGKRIKSQKIF